MQKFWRLLYWPASHGPFWPKLWMPLVNIFVEIFLKEKNWSGFRPYLVTLWKEFEISLQNGILKIFEQVNCPGQFSGSWIRQNSSMMCSLMNHRGILWPSTPPGSTVVQPCIAGSASWRCTKRGQWAPSPDLSLCQRKNWSSFEVKDLENLDGSSTINLYGGDIVALLERVASLTDQFPSETNTRYSPINCFR